MTDKYHGGSGMLLLSKITPIISVLFGTYNLYIPERFTGIAFIHRCGNHQKWRHIHNSFENLAAEKGLVLPANSDHVLPAYLKLFGRFFSIEDEAFYQFIDRQSFIDDDEPSLRTLFKLANYFNDRHGLFAIFFTASDWSAQNSLCDFKAEADFISKEFIYNIGTMNLFNFSAGMRHALIEDDFIDAALCLVKQTEKSLEGITNPTARKRVRTQLVHRLSSSNDNH